jgi:hypothetical protein
VYTTIANVRRELVLFAVTYNVLSFPSAVALHITVGPFYDKMATLGDAFYHITLSNVAGAQVN